MESLYLIQDGESTGPHDLIDVIGMLDDKEIMESDYAFCEGMKDWRSVNEALLYAEAKELKFTRSEVESIIFGRTDNATARLGLKNLLLEKQVFPMFDTHEVFRAIVGLNRQAKNCLAQARQGTTETALSMFPAQELVQISVWTGFSRDWRSAWIQAGGIVFGERMVAMKDDPVWFKLSDFKFPCPPFSVVCEMGVRNVRRSEAVALGLMEQFGEVIPMELPDRPPWILIEDDEL